MPDFLPFRGVRYAATTTLDHVGAPPYDVIDPPERAELAARDEHNVVRLILPEAGAGFADEYATAAADLDAWLADGTLVVDDAPTYTVYRMSFTDRDGQSRHTVGVLGALALPTTHGEGDVLPHERTIPKHRDDRLRLLRATRANLDPIWGLSLAKGLRELLLPLVVTPPDASATDESADGGTVVHESWTVRDPETVEALRAFVADEPIVLADGHHRFQTACTYRDELAAAGASTTGADAILTYLVELDDVDLYVRPIERVIRGVDGPAARGRLAATCTLTPVAAAAPSEHGPVWVDREGAWLVEPDGPAHDAIRAAEPEPIASTDAACFETVIAPALGDGAEITYRHDPAHVARLVAAGDADAAVLLRPVTVDQIRTAAIERLRFPQKSTFFAPKPRTGFVLRLLDRT